MSSIKLLLKRLLPEHTKRWLAVTLLLTLVTRPDRLRYRLNPQNIRDFRRFARTKAHCCICGSTGTLLFGMPDIELCRHFGNHVLRETLLCKACGSTNRQRTLAHVLISVLHRQFACEGAALDGLMCRTGKAEIWDTDAFGPIGARVGSVANVTRSKYLPQLPFGVETEPGVYNIDLQGVSFPSNRFDVILTSDVMEHVRDDRRAQCGNIPPACAPAAPLICSRSRTPTVTAPGRGTWWIPAPPKTSSSSHRIITAIRSPGKYSRTASTGAT